MVFLIEYIHKPNFIECLRVVLKSKYFYHRLLWIQALQHSYWWITFTLNFSKLRRTDKIFQIFRFNISFFTLLKKFNDKKSLTSLEFYFFVDPQRTFFVLVFSEAFFVPVFYRSQCTPFLLEGDFKRENNISILTIFTKDNAKLDECKNTFNTDFYCKPYQACP